MISIESPSPRLIVIQDDNLLLDDERPLESLHPLLPAWHRLGPPGPGELRGRGASQQRAGELSRLTLVNYQVVAGCQLEDGLHCNYHHR